MVTIEFQGVLPESSSFTPSFSDLEGERIIVSSYLTLCFFHWFVQIPNEIGKSCHSSTGSADAITEDESGHFGCSKNDGNDSVMETEPCIV